MENQYVYAWRDLRWNKIDQYEDRRRDFSILSYCGRRGRSRDASFLSSNLRLHWDSTLTEQDHCERTSYAHSDASKDSAVAELDAYVQLRRHGSAVTSALMRRLRDVWHCMDDRIDQGLEHRPSDCIPMMLSTMGPWDGCHYLLMKKNASVVFRSGSMPFTLHIVAGCGWAGRRSTTCNTTIII